MATWQVFGVDDKMKFHFHEIRADKLEDLENKCKKKGLTDYNSRKKDRHKSKYVLAYALKYREYYELYHEDCYTIDDATAFVKSHLSSDDCYALFNTKTAKIIKINLLSWKNRNDAKNIKEAMAYIGDKLSENWESLNDIKEVEKYAKQFNIPFSVPLTKAIRKGFNVNQPQWNSSSAYC